MKIPCINLNSLIIVFILAIISCTALCVSLNGPGQKPATLTSAPPANDSIKNGTNNTSEISNEARLVVKEMEVRNGTVHKLVLVEGK